MKNSLQELGHIKTTFFSNGDPAALISSATTHATARPEEHVPSPTAPLLILPYYNGLGEKIKRMGTSTHPGAIANCTQTLLPTSQTST
ncbi:hypothetical protein M514_26644 [Trichuris suis]|uniref:Uncharacterized protein n=1 Tax=Trichuris suis TaxID=68888 RepID=A0A085MVB1_9BILA|nr:hypothetical protein M514_26644 [Trichuris suis]